MQNGTHLAAVDLGSNSFRLEIGCLDHGLIQRTEYIKETVRQGASLDANRLLNEQAMERGWECLARFGERLAGFSKSHVRAVATQTLREASNRDVFLKRATKLLGFQIDVIPGREEARLIYQGVARMLPQTPERRLVIDVGGRSTEIVLGQGLQAITMESWQVGSVNLSMEFFPHGLFTLENFKAAEIAAQAVLEEAFEAFGPSHWDTAYGSSGTVGAVSDVLDAAGWPIGQISLQSLDWLRERLIKAQSSDRLKLDGLRDDRRAVVGGGVSVLRAIFKLLNIDNMLVAQGALRHGVLYDLLDREHGATDLRGRTIERLTHRFGVDMAQADRVSRIAQRLLAMTPPPNEDLQRLQRKLEWASRVHEIGCHISHQDHHKHGAYILEHVDAPGFAMEELQRLSLLVLGQRGKLRKIEEHLNNEVFARQLLTLRLALILAHARREPNLNGLVLSDQPSFTLSLPPGWAERFPQSAHLLREEALAWQKTDCPLRLVEG